MKKVLILQMRPEDETADAEFLAILEKGGLEKEQVDRIRVEKSPKLDIELANYSAIIAGGSPFDLSTPLAEKSDSQLAVEDFFQRLFTNVIAADFPFLGACSGNGLLGQYCQVKISTRYAEPIGAIEVNLTEAAKTDDLLEGFPPSFLALVGHKEACDDFPKESTALVTSPACPVQMFRLKNNIYATQFHPEADEHQFSLRIDIYKNYGYFDPKEVESLKAQLRDVATPWSNQILKRFVSKYAKS